MRISIIVAIAENGVIGRDGKLPWHLSSDLRRFKRLTMGHTVVMGRRTWESIGRPLPGRRMVVVSRQPDYDANSADVRVVNSLEDALQLAQTAADEEAFIIGGGELYQAALPRVDRIYLTRVQGEVRGDTVFHLDNLLDWDEWTNIESENHEADEQNDHAHSFAILERREAK